MHGHDATGCRLQPRRQQRLHPRHRPLPRVLHRPPHPPQRNPPHPASRRLAAPAQPAHERGAYAPVAASPPYGVAAAAAAHQIPQGPPQPRETAAARRARCHNVAADVATSRYTRPSYVATSLFTWPRPSYVATSLFTWPRPSSRAPERRYGSVGRASLAEAAPSRGGWAAESLAPARHSRPRVGWR